MVQEDSGVGVSWVRLGLEVLKSGQKAELGVLALTYEFGQVSDKRAYRVTLII